MKTIWVIVLLVVALAFGFFVGGAAGVAGGAAGGSVAGVCYALQVGRSEGMLTQQQSDALLQAIATKHADASRKLDIAGDLAAACKDMAARH